MERKGLRVNIEKTMDGGKLTIALEGRLDTVTAPRLEAEIKNGLAGSPSWNLIFPDWSTSRPPGCGCCFPPERL